MYPAHFDYYRATTVDEAIGLLGQHDDAKVLAGGHSLLPMMKLRLAQPGALVDIGRIEELRQITHTGDAVRIGALATHADIAASEVVRKHSPLLAEAAAAVGDPQVRNKGTLGGNIAHADPASDLPATLLASCATIHLRGPGGGRQVAATDFFVDLLTTDLQDGEILLAAEIKAFPAGSGSAYLKFEHPASGYAVCGAAAVVAFEGGTVSTASLAFNGVTAVPVEAGEVARALVGTAGDDAAIDAAVDRHLAFEDPLGDVQASGEFRAHLGTVYGKRALKRARDRARG